MGGGLLQWPQDSLQEEPWFFPRHSDGEMGAGWNWELLFCQLAPGGSDILKLTLQFAGGSTGVGVVPGEPTASQLWL